MFAKILIAAAALSLSIGAADAAHRHKHKPMHARHHTHARPAHAMPASPNAFIAQYPTRPPWAQPWQCFTDEGYGRFRACDAGPSIGGR